MLQEVPCHDVIDSHFPNEKKYLHQNTQVDTNIITEFYFDVETGTIKYKTMIGKLTRLQAEAFWVLLQHSGYLVENGVLMASLYGGKAEPEVKSLYKHIYNANRRLTSIGLPKLIRKVRGRGYYAFVEQVI